MPVLDITNFSTTAIKTSTGHIEMVAYQEEAEVVDRTGFLGDGSTKYDVDGANNSDVKLGQVRCRFKLTPATAGMWALNTQLKTLEDLRGVRGRLMGYQYGTSTTWRYTCTARCVLVQVENYAVHSSPPLVGLKKQQAFINVVWEQLSSWSNTSVY